MKKRWKRFIAFFISTALLCMNGCGNKEDDYKNAIAEHMKANHGVSIDSYDSFVTNDGEGARASVNVIAQMEIGGTVEMRAQLSVDKDSNISSCSWCKLGL